MEFEPPYPQYPNLLLCPNRKLSDEQVEEIRHRWNNRPTAKTMAEEYGVSPFYIQALVQNRKRVKKPQRKQVDL